MRIAIACTVLGDLIIRMGSLEAHYTQHGVWPANLVFTFIGKPGAWSFHCLYDTYAWEVFLFGFHVLLGLTLLLGYKTRITTVLLWLFTISLHNRNIYILQAGDDLLRLTLFWGIFLNWGSHYSIDSKLAQKSSNSPMVAQAGYLMLLVSVYLFTVLLKSGDEWRVDGTAVYYALSLEQLRLPFTGDWLYAHPLLMQWITRLVYGIEIMIPLLLLWPSHKKITFGLAFVLILLLHIGIGLTLYVGLFFFINMVTAIALLPESFFIKLEKKWKLFVPPPSVSETSSTNRFLLNGFLSLIIFLNFLINLGGLQFFPYQPAPPLTYLGFATGMDQYWGMFSPNILKKDAWPVLYGVDDRYRQWDLRTNTDYVDFAKPKHIVSLYTSDRWRKLSENLQSENYTFLRAPYCKFMLKYFNRKHPEKKIVNLNLYFMSEENLAGYKTTPPKKELYCVCNEP